MLIVLIASAVGVFCIVGWLPEHIAKTRGHPWADVVTVAGWVTQICGFALWPVAPMGLCRCAGSQQGGVAAMMIAILAVYLVLLFVLVRIDIIRFNTLLENFSPYCSVPFEAQVKGIEAQLKLSDMRLAQMTQLFERDSGRAFDVQ